MPEDLLCHQNVLEIPLSTSLPNPTDSVIFTFTDGLSVRRTWATILGGLTPNDIEFKVGASGYPGDGSTSYTSALLRNRRVRVYRNSQKQSKLSNAGGFLYAFNPVTGTITFTPALTQDEIIQIEIY